MAGDLQVRDDYIEVRLYGVLDGSQRPPLTPEPRPQVEGLKVLFDRAGVERVALPLDELVSAFVRLDAGGLRAAFYAPEPALSGINRQAIQMSGAAEGYSLSVFREKEAAVNWLMAPGHIHASEAGGSGAPPLPGSAENRAGRGFCAKIPSGPRARGGACAREAGIRVVCADGGGYERVRSAWGVDRAEPGALHGGSAGGGGCGICIRAGAGANALLRGVGGVLDDLGADRAADDAGGGEARVHPAGDDGEDGDDVRPALERAD